MVPRSKVNSLAHSGKLPYSGRLWPFLAEIRIRDGVKQRIRSLLTPTEFPFRFCLIKHSSPAGNTQNGNSTERRSRKRRTYTLFYPHPQNTLPGPNTLAYSASACVTMKRKFYNIDTWSQCYKPFYDSNLQMFIIRLSICTWQAFPAQSNLRR